MKQATLLAQQQNVFHVLGIEDLETSLHTILATAKRLKSRPHDKPLQGKAILLIFEKPSTRTRVSFEVGITRLGGTPVILDAQSTQLARGESMYDTAKVLSRYGDALVYRANNHADLESLAQHADIPVVNALTDVEHPCQVLADWMTLSEAWGSMQGRTFAYIGDGNNMCHSYLLGAAMAGMHIRVATPPQHKPDMKVLEQALVLANRHGTDILWTPDPKVAVQGADAVATDTWISMGDEADEVARLKAFQGFTVDQALMDQAQPGALFMHCLPGHWGQEATERVAYGTQSVIFDQAENRMWVQMALLTHLLGPRPSV